MEPDMIQATSSFGELLRHWRRVRRFSQLELALQADISSKRVSFLETGRNRPSRDMILRLAQAMDLPLLVLHGDHDFRDTAGRDAAGTPHRVLFPVG
jgi:transcriptional regulator with XRE-family HTH domain